MSGPIVVINPNSNQAVTDGLKDALAAFDLPDGPDIECLTLAEGPFGIESQLDSDSVVLPLAKLVQSRADAGAFVIACYSDPGLDACRSVAPQPVFGIQESGVLTAMARADRFGVIAIAEASVQRHRRTMARMQVLDRLACEIPLNMSVDETARGTGTFDRLVAVGTALKEQGQAWSFWDVPEWRVIGPDLRQKLNIPVIDPTQAAVAMALGALLAG